MYVDNVITSKLMNLVPMCRRSRVNDLFLVLGTCQQIKRKLLLSENAAQVDIFIENGNIVKKTSIYGKIK